MPQTFIELLEERIKSHWDLPAFSDYGSDSRSYGDIADRITWLHYIFRQSRIKPGDKIAVIGRNSSNWAITYLAAVSYGAVIVPILPDFHVEDIHHIINHSDSVFLFSSDAIFETLDFEIMPNLEGCFSLSDFRLLDNRKRTIPQILSEVDFEYLKEYDGNLTKNNLSLSRLGNDELAAIVYTSGTTGFSKGAMLPHGSLFANVDFAERSIDLQAGNRIVSFMPLAHSYGCAFEFLFPFIVGCHVTFLSKMPSPKIIVEAFQNIRPHLILSVPLIIEKIYRKRLKPTISKPTMKAALALPGVNRILEKKICAKLNDVFGSEFIEIIVGGAALNPEVESFFKRIGFHITVGYGMTECGPLISYSGWSEHRPGSVGKLVDTLDIKFDSPDPTKVVGEILVRGSNVMKGYYKNKEATNQVLDEDGWLHTGDLGLMDGEGFIYLKGRSKSLLLGPSGQNIYPEEVEAKLNYMPYVQESLVIQKEGKLYALVYPDLERVDAEKIDETTLMTFMEENRKNLNTLLPSYSAIVKIELYPEEFEKTPTKKIKRFLHQAPV